MDGQSNQEFAQNLIRRVYRYSLKVINLTDNLPKDRPSWVIGDQLIRSATSIGANIIEAQAASSKKDFINFLSHALKSANETKFWLGLLRDSGKAKITAINPLLEETKQIADILGSSILTLKGKRRL